MGRKFTRKDLESLIGKLQFVTACVRPGRIFISRLLNALRGPAMGVHKAEVEMCKDIDWWKKYLTEYNGVSILWPEVHLVPNEQLASDSCLTGLGGRQCVIGNIFTTSCQQNDRVGILPIWRCGG